MPHALAQCHPPWVARRAEHHQNGLASPPPPPAAAAVELVADQASQQLNATASRAIHDPREFLHAAAWAVGTGLHPKAGASTIRVAEDIAARVGWRGQVVYDWDGTAARVGLSRRRVADHVRYLRELGLLVWHTHGSRANARKRRGRDGYAATATIYALAVPRIWDEAMGRRIAGEGYYARITGYTAEGRARAVDDARVVSRRRKPRCTPSLRSQPQESCTAEVGGKETDPAQPEPKIEAPVENPRRRPAKRPANNRPGRHPHQVRAGLQVAAKVRPLVTWAQRIPLRRLEVALRPLLDRGWDPELIAIELAMWARGWGLDRTGHPWRPDDPAGYLHARIRRMFAPAGPELLPADDETCRCQACRENAPASAIPNQAARAAITANLAEYPVPEPPQPRNEWEDRAAAKEAFTALAARLAEEARTATTTFAQWCVSDAEPSGAWRKPWLTPDGAR
ncbi:hypothetical protein [Actinacidiphila sp. bgisy160]|uniref:hypothetical protein n=1 Tax=Actinacidiphila sp. bgisy160 TaxID=3413796 RepID=UPI003D72D494